MIAGTVKWYNDAKGYGFIQPDAGGKDDFVHISALERAGLHHLEAGDRVEYELKRNKSDRLAAENIKVVGKADIPESGYRR